MKIKNVYNLGKPLMCRRCTEREPKQWNSSTNSSPVVLLYNRRSVNLCKLYFISSKGTPFTCKINKFQLHDGFGAASDP